MDKDTVNVTFRLPRSLHRELVELAKQEHRSLNGQVLAMLSEREVAAKR